MNYFPVLWKTVLYILIWIAWNVSRILYVIADVEMPTKVKVASIEIVKNTHAIPGYPDISATHLLLFIWWQDEEVQ